MISITGLNKAFNAGKPNEVIALQAVDLEIKQGEYVVVIGSNGSGKSTLLNLIAGSMLPTGGSVNIEGNDITKLAEYQRSKWIARIFQNPLSGTAADLSIIDNFRLAALRTKSKNLVIGKTEQFKQLVKERIAALNMGLENKLDQPIGTLSGGQRQALTLLMSVMDECKILLLDEPTAALDPRSANNVLKIADDLIKQYKLTALLVTHNLRDAAVYGNRIIQMHEGQILKDISDAEKTHLQQNQLFEWFA